MVIFRPMKASDVIDVFTMMRDFYDHFFGTGAVPDDVLWTNIHNCVEDFPYADGWSFADGSALAGYAICSRGYDASRGAVYVRIEDLYVADAYRLDDIGPRFLKELAGLYPDAAYYCLQMRSGSRFEANTYRQLGYGTVRQIATTETGRRA